MQPFNVKRCLCCGKLFHPHVDLPGLFCGACREFEIQKMPHSLPDVLFLICLSYL